MSDNIEGGNLYTRDKHIVLSESFCKKIVRLQQLPSENRTHFYLELLSHEQMHVFQRMHPGHCDSLYTELLGFEKADSISGCNWLVKHQLTNPDAVICRWVLPIKEGDSTRYLWPLLVFSEGDAYKRMPADIRIIAIFLTKKDKGFAVQLANDDRPVFQNLLQTPEFRARFPLSSNIYHPNEIAADMFAKIIIFDNFTPANALSPEKKNTMEKHFAPLREWFKKNLRNPTEPIVSDTSIR